MAANRVHQKQRVVYLSNKRVDFDDFYIKLYVFWGAESIYEVTETIRGRNRMVKVNIVPFWAEKPIKWHIYIGYSRACRIGSTSASHDPPIPFSRSLLGYFWTFNMSPVAYPWGKNGFSGRFSKWPPPKSGIFRYLYINHYTSHKCLTWFIIMFTTE